VLSEYRRAFTAQRRYEDLRRHAPTLVAVSDVPRRLFREFYANMSEKPDGEGHVAQQAE
jgi:hypothetical protein